MSITRRSPMAPFGGSSSKLERVRNSKSVDSRKNSLCHSGGDQGEGNQREIPLTLTFPGTNERIPKSSRIGDSYVESPYPWNDVPDSPGGLSSEYPSAFDTDVLRFKYYREYWEDNFSSQASSDRRKDCSRHVAYGIEISSTGALPQSVLL